MKKVRDILIKINSAYEQLLKHSNILIEKKDLIPSFHPQEKQDELASIEIEDEILNKIREKIQVYNKRQFYFEKFIPIFHKLEISDEFNIEPRELLAHLIYLIKNKKIEINNIFGTKYLFSKKVGS